VRIDVTFFVIAVLLGVGARSGSLLVAWVVVVLFSVLIHEMGHAIAFRRFGVPPEILLQGMGGLTYGTQDKPLTAGQRITMSLAGPLTGLALIGLPALWLSRTATHLSPNWHTILSDIVFVNLAWSIVNLLPILPLDGGQVAAALLSQRAGDDGMRRAHVLSAAVAAAAGLFALTRGYLFGAVYAGFFAAFNLRGLSAARNADLNVELVDGWRALARGDTAAAADVAQKVLADRPSAAMMTGANELLAWSRLTQEDATGARAAIARYPPGHTPDPMLLAALELEADRPEEALARLDQAYRSQRFGPAAAMVANAVARAGLHQVLADRFLAPGGAGPDAAALLAAHLHVAGRYEESIAVGARAFDAGSGDRGQLAYNLACSYARARQVDAAFVWLDRALDVGFTDDALLRRDPDLDILRDDHRFATARRRLEPRA
jgi:Zn-dependent protease